jgi:chemotaxis protein CheZ
MLSNEAIINELMERLTERIAADLRDSLSQAIEREITQNLSRTLMEGEFYRRLGEEMHTGLKEIYHEISGVRKADGAPLDAEPPTQEEAGEIIAEASDQLDEILKTTQKATEQIMEIVEKHLDLHNEASDFLANLGQEGIEEGNLVRFQQINDQMTNDLIEVMTALSFQDLTGQRIKRIITALKKIEEITFTLYLSTGLKMRAKEADPEKDFEALAAEAEQKVSDLKGPQNEVSQGDVDDLLSQLGLE